MTTWQKAWLGLGFTMMFGAVAKAQPEHVVLLHGLARSEKSMEPMEAALTEAGYTVSNIGYASRRATIDQLADDAVGRGVAACRAKGAVRIHFVTHSMGGILVRSHLARHEIPELGRVVMLGPPNAGSEVVDRIGGWRLFQAVNGPAGRQLGTDADSLPVTLGPVSFPVGVIAGNRSINWINSAMIPGPDDGKVSVERTKVAGMRDHIVVAATHPFMMRKDEVIRQVIHFLREERFSRDP